ncbi:MAG: ATP synthase F0 subunit B [Deltaproteobacteria bacterium]|nr:ATP synthase F0 subunit B [Deltaproteobacteria bacterium]
MKWRKIALVLLILPAILAVTGTAYGAGAEESPWTLSMLIWRVINTVALIAVLVYFMKKPLASFFAERTSQISKDLEEARDQRARAEALLQEYKQRLAGMEKELEKMRAELQKSSEAERERVVAAAERLAASTVETAKLTAEQEVRKAKAALKAEAVDLAMEMAETLIREKITEDDRKRIAEDYLVKVGGMK